MAIELCFGNKWIQLHHLKTYITYLGVRDQYCCFKLNFIVHFASPFKN